MFLPLKRRQDCKTGQEGCCICSFRKARHILYFFQENVFTLETGWQNRTRGLLQFAVSEQTCWRIVAVYEKPDISCTFSRKCFTVKEKTGGQNRTRGLLQFADFKSRRVSCTCVSHVEPNKCFFAKCRCLTSYFSSLHFHPVWKMFWSHCTFKISQTLWHSFQSAENNGFNGTKRTTMTSNLFSLCHSTGSFCAIRLYIRNVVDFLRGKVPFWPKLFFPSEAPAAPVSSHKKHPLPPT